MSLGDWCVNCVDRLLNDGTLCRSDQLFFSVEVDLGPDGEDRLSEKASPPMK